jgi:hypothetical protein
MHQKETFLFIPLAGLQNQTLILFQRTDILGPEIIKCRQGNHNETRIIYLESKSIMKPDLRAAVLIVAQSKNQPASSLG